MKKKIEKTFALVAALSSACAPALLMVVGFWMIYNVGLWIGLALSAVGYFALVWEYAKLQMHLESKKKKTK